MCITAWPAWPKYINFHKESAYMHFNSDCFPSASCREHKNVISLNQQSMFTFSSKSLRCSPCNRPTIALQSPCTATLARTSGHRVLITVIMKLNARPAPLPTRQIDTRNKWTRNGEVGRRNRRRRSRRREGSAVGGGNDAQAVGGKRGAEAAGQKLPLGKGLASGQRNWCS